MIRRDWFFTLVAVLLFGVACADSPPRGPGTTWRSWHLERWYGRTFEEEIIELSIRPSWTERHPFDSPFGRLVVNCNSEFPIFEMDERIGNSGKPVEVHTWIDDDKSGIQEHVWTIGQDSQHLIATPEFLDEIRPRHLRLDIVMFLPGKEPEWAAYSLANFHFLHTKHCKTSGKFKYYD